MDSGYIFCKHVDDLHDTQKYTLKISFELNKIN